MTKLSIRVAAVLIGAVALSAQTRPARPAVERTITPAAAGPARVAVDMPLLVGSNPAPKPFADLRLFDSRGREVPYLLIAPPARAVAWLSGTILPVASRETTTEKTSGFEVDLGTPALVDTLRLDGMAAPFLKRALLEGSGDRERWTMLAPEATVFDLPVERLKRTEIGFVRGDYRYLRVTWDDTHSGRVAPPTTVAARRVDTNMEAPRPLTAAVVFERRVSEPGKSRFRIRLPAATLPLVRLDLDVEGAYVMRQANVTEPRFDGRQLQPWPIGEATLKRITRDGVRADELSIPVSRPTETELDLVVNDENNPPLALRSVIAVFDEMPTIYFESDGRPLTARYGGRRLDPPRYDIEAARESVRVETATPAVWGEPSAVTTTDAAPAPVSPMPAAGATLEVGQFRHSRTIPAGPAGLVALPLDAAVLAHSAGPDRGFADVRVLDSTGRQIPYVVERRDEPYSVNVDFAAKSKPPGGVEATPGQSWYALQVPYDHLPLGRLTIETSARVFRRAVSLVRETPDVRRGPQLVTLDSGIWLNANPDLPAMPLQFSVPGLPTRDVFLSIDEGDNAALPVQKITLLLPSYRLRFVRPEQSALTLAYGRNDLSPPEYDLTLLAPEVLGATAENAEASTERQAENAAGGVLLRPGVFWAVIGVALIVLLAMIVRLVRSESLKAGQP